MLPGNSQAMFVSEWFRSQYSSFGMMLGSRNVSQEAERGLQSPGHEEKGNGG